MFGRILNALRPWPTHPIDRQYGIETSSRVRRFLIRTGDAAADRSNVGYVGSQPSIVRLCLGLIPDLDGAAFFDLGCGKGRILAVATEYPFAAITGIELSALVARIATRNCARLAARHPDRTRVQVIHGDASRPNLPDAGTVVLYLYNPFHGDVTASLIENLTRDLRVRPGLKLWVVYYNPAQAALFDAAPAFARYYAAKHDVSAEERASSPFGNDYDSVAIWQSRSEPMAPALPHADRVVEIEVPNLMAHVRHESPAD
jgi:SAM-dependent methyltransferase